MLTQLLNLLLDPCLALVHTTFDAGDGPAEWANNIATHHCLSTAPLHDDLAGVYPASIGLAFPYCRSPVAN